VNSSHQLHADARRTAASHQATGFVMERLHASARFLLAENGSTRERVMGEDLEAAGKPWNYHDDPKTMAAIAIGAAILGIVLAFALNSAGERTSVATNAPAPVTAPPFVPTPPVGSKVEPKT